MKKKKNRFSPFVEKRKKYNTFTDNIQRRIFRVGARTRCSAQSKLNCPNYNSSTKSESAQSRLELLLLLLHCNNKKKNGAHAQTINRKKSVTLLFIIKSPSSILRPVANEPKKKKNGQDKAKGHS